MADTLSPAALRVAFAGTPEFAACALEAILEAGYTVPLVLTQPDRPAGRGMKLTPSAVKQLALARGIEVDQPERLRTDEQRARLSACAPDVLVVAAYGLILPKAVLDMPRLGCLNIHASLLPRWRGAAPIHRAIEAGDAATGITIMQMDEGLDTGAMLLERSTPILPRDTTATLHDRLAALGGECIVAALAALQRGELVARPQPAEGVTYAAKIGRAEANIDWTRPAADIERATRAFDPFPGAASSLRDTVVKCWSAEVVPGRGEPGTVIAAGDDGITVACGRDALRCTVLQRPGSKRLPAAEFLRGFPVSVGERFATVA
ncbi:MULTISPECIES: methionyl-tRNA formyltransferase [unclassified Thauera]|uniref:methionyl-tRNA formyltransferase n=1 Tax=unclassified Thauera TaxID=2609274 RepID=UPI0002CDCDD0|nr:MULTISPECIES: methionyl-tRNA formyltransferase [unclassified Thauera]ENO91041.1 methionyl-tRNA formyltransferase [Thauera sp. 28]WBL64412.1 methionyl-tRNA formyltransferase [Thauera sp. WB-2]HNR61834.1 methionyl-tRNA formyltransferase [Thauera sp.]HNS91540.1 methionyl-tRNA formyltransferase [Thauera sp.]